MHGRTTKCIKHSAVSVCIVVLVLYFVRCRGTQRSRSLKPFLRHQALAPKPLDRDWVGNWLNVYLKVESKTGNWQTVDPSLTTFEVQELIDWLNDLANNSKPKWIAMEFTEPNLSLYLQNDYNDFKKLIRIKFNLESRPKSVTEDKEYFVDFDADNSELKDC